MKKRLAYYIINIEASTSYIMEIKSAPGGRKISFFNAMT